VINDGGSVIKRLWSGRVWPIKWGLGTDFLLPSHEFALAPKSNIEVPFVLRKNTTFFGLYKHETGYSYSRKLQLSLSSKNGVELASLRVILALPVWVRLAPDYSRFFPWDHRRFSGLAWNFRQSIPGLRELLP
jgi:hypothetical protein